MTIRQPNAKLISLVLAVSCATAIFLFSGNGDFTTNPKTPAMAAIAILMAVLWMSEAIPLAATALLPLVLFPLLGIASTKSVAGHYMNSTVFLLLGGFLIALAMQRWNLHRRIALTVLSTFGNQPKQLLLGFSVASALLSMWISNTATTLMMLPIALAILDRLEVTLGTDVSAKLATGLLLTIAYSSSIGGMMTPVGTAPNLVLMRLLETSDAASSIGFAEWMLLTVPIGILLLGLLIVILRWLYCNDTGQTHKDLDYIQQEKNRLGRLSFEEKCVAIAFSCAAILWVTRKKMQLGSIDFPGWQDLLPHGAMIDDSTVAIAIALLLFLIPAKLADGTKTYILDHSVFAQLPWPVVLLFGGGFALASGFVESGLSAYLAQQLSSIEQMDLATRIYLITASMTFVTELTSNTATTQLVLPILLSLSQASHNAAQWLMVPATLAASCAFMFPVATPPNAIIFGSGRISMYDMLRTGFCINLLAILIIATLSQWLLPFITGI
jgi:sodium-dependent dicarboxylate transporter 2/3/5